ncbi:mucin-5AC-like, partial [Stegodyphus dumicola]|uniref:mucin-5AC-like n=1 Tax=Stegodyphus dumicola TaxID=202533 RepID=UPI0015AAA2B9
VDRGVPAVPAGGPVAGSIGTCSRAVHGVPGAAVDHGVPAVPAGAIPGSNGVVPLAPGSAADASQAIPGSIGASPGAPDAEAEAPGLSEAIPAYPGASEDIPVTAGAFPVASVPGLIQSVPATSQVAAADHGSSDGNSCVVAGSAGAIPALGASASPEIATGGSRAVPASSSATAHPGVAAVVPSATPCLPGAGSSARSVPTYYYGSIATSEATPTGSSSLPRHVPAFVTPSGPPLSKGGHLRQLLDRIQAKTSGCTPLLPVVTCQPSERRTPEGSSLAKSAHTSSSAKDTPTTPQSTFACYVCGLECTSRRGLRRHTRTHVQEKDSQLHPPPDRRVAASIPGSLISPVCHHTRARTAAGHACSSNTLTISPPRTYAEALSSPSMRESSAHPASTGPLCAVITSTAGTESLTSNVPAKSKVNSTPTVIPGPKTNASTPQLASAVTCPDCGRSCLNKKQLRSHRHLRHRQAPPPTSPGDDDFTSSTPETLTDAASSPPAAPAPGPVHTDCTASGSTDAAPQPALTATVPVTTSPSKDLPGESDVAPQVPCQTRLDTTSSAGDTTDADVLILCLTPSERTDLLSELPDSTRS